MAEKTEAFEEYKTGGWDMLSGMETAPKPMSDEEAANSDENQLREYELNSTILRALSTPDGQVFFEFMREMATEGARFSLEEENPIKAAAVGFFREGQAVFYFDCKRRMNRAAQGPPTAAKKK